MLFFDEYQPTLPCACTVERSKKSKNYPLKIYLCKECLLGFNGNPLQDEELKFIYDDYSYISPFKGIGTSKQDQIIVQLKKYSKKDDFIVEIGCSDGYTLKMLSDMGYNNLLGYEPAQQAKYAISLGLNIVNDFFTENSLGNKKVDIFYLMHVFEHLPDPFKTLNVLSNKLNDKGKIMLEVPYFTAYEHQHLFFYSINFLKELAKKNNLIIIDAKVNSSILNIVFQKSSNNTGVGDIFDDKEWVVNTTINQYEFNKKEKSRINNIISNAKSQVYWWGAGSLSGTYLTKITDDNLKKIKIIDGDSNKWNKVMPCNGMEVRPYTDIVNSKIDTLIIASEFDKEIRDTISNNNITVNNIFTIL
jgi:2-polyprenyl-3-methyl-5-hydroxy-6-metoxy-1,4-benzoquinol methylase